MKFVKSLVYSQWRVETNRFRIQLRLDINKGNRGRIFQRLKERQDNRALHRAIQIRIALRSLDKITEAIDQMRIQQERTPNEARNRIRKEQEKGANNDNFSSRHRSIGCD